MSKPRKRRPAPLRWISVAQHGLRVTRGDRALFVFVVGSDPWAVGAIETARDAAAPNAVFGDHSHAIIGEYFSPALAFSAAESYAVAWREGERPSEPKCECDEIDAEFTP